MARKKTEDVMREERTEDSKRENKARFIKALAQFLAGDQAKKSMLLDPRMDTSLASSIAKEWAACRAASPIFGYVTVEEAEKKLTEWLS